MIKVGFIDYYLDEGHANNYVHMLHDDSTGEVEAVYAWAEIDSPESGLTTDAWCEKYGLTRMMTQEELIEKSDVLLVLAPRDPKKHEELASLALRSGKRCYVDNTFAPDHFAAKRMLDLAEQSGTPCWSSSALRFAEEYQAADKTNIKGVNAWGPNGFEDYAIHQLEPIFMMMQAPATEVMHLTNDEVYTGVLRFADGRNAFRLRKGLAVHDEHCALHGKFRTGNLLRLLPSLHRGARRVLQKRHHPCSAQRDALHHQRLGRPYGSRKDPRHLGQSPEGLSLLLQKPSQRTRR